MPETNLIFEQVYAELKAIAQARMGSERREHTLSATALVNEVYLKLAPPRDKPWDGRGHFFTAVVEAMRQILYGSSSLIYVCHQPGQ